MDYEHDDPFGGLHDDCVPTEDVVSYVLEHHLEEIEEALAESRAEEWVSESKPCLELLSIVSQNDQAQLRAALRRRLRKNPSDEAGVTEDQLFAIAGDVSAYLEQLPHAHPAVTALQKMGPDSYQRYNAPTAAGCVAFSASACTLEGDFSWAKDLLTVTRAFRDFLAVVADANLQEPFLRLHLRGPIELFNNYLHKSQAQSLVYWQGADKQLRFARCPDPQSSDLSSFLANWISEYLKDQFSYVSLGACMECGKFFARERRDKTFCSKTCQNRVAYKRKKILDSGALAAITVLPDNACDISVGIWMHHPRYGIGLIESVSSDSRPMAGLLAKFSSNPDSLIRYRSMLSRKVLLQVRFLQGIRTLSYTDLFEGQKKEEQLPTFYEVKSEETLAELL
jgi:hypothetical protein